MEFFNRIGREDSLADWYWRQRRCPANSCQRRAEIGLPRADIWRLRYHSGKRGQRVRNNYEQIETLLRISLQRLSNGTRTAVFARFLLSLHGGDDLVGASYRSFIDWRDRTR